MLCNPVDVRIFPLLPLSLLEDTYKFTTPYQNIKSDKCVCIRAPFNFEPQSSSPSPENHNPTEHPNLTTPAAAYLTGDHYHLSHLPPNKAEGLESCCAKAQDFGDVHADYVPLTRPALQEHNTKNNSPRSDESTQCLALQGHAYGTGPVNTKDTPASASYEHATFESYFYSQYSHQLHIPAAPRPEYDQNIRSGYLQHVIKHWENYPYPLFIQQADLDPEATDSLHHQTAQPEYPPMHHLLFQESSSYNYNLAGVGAQFSREML